MIFGVHVCLCRLIHFPLNAELHNIQVSDGMSLHGWHFIVLLRWAWTIVKSILSDLERVRFIKLKTLMAFCHSDRGL